MSLLGDVLLFVNDTIRRCFLLLAGAWPQRLPNGLEKDIERQNGKDADKDAKIGRPLTPMSYDVARRTARRCAVGMYYC